MGQEANITKSFFSWEGFCISSQEAYGTRFDVLTNLMQNFTVFCKVLQNLTTKYNIY